MNDSASASIEYVEEGGVGAPRSPHPFYALKDGDTFLVTAPSGDISGAGDGLFHNDTRILSRFSLLLGDQPPSLLSAAITQDNVFFTAHGANRPIPLPGGHPGPPEVVHVER